MQELALLFNSQARTLANKWRVGPVESYDRIAADGVRLLSATG